MLDVRAEVGTERARLVERCMVRSGCMHPCRAYECYMSRTRWPRSVSRGESLSVSHHAPDRHVMKREARERRVQAQAHTRRIFV